MNKNTKLVKFGNYIRETIMNKIVSLILIMIGVLSTFIDNDATFLVFTLIIGIPLFFEKDNCISG